MATIYGRRDNNLTQTTTTQETARSFKIPSSLDPVPTVIQTWKKQADSGLQDTTGVLTFADFVENGQTFLDSFAGLVKSIVAGKHKRQGSQNTPAEQLIDYFGAELFELDTVRDYLSSDEADWILADVNKDIEGELYNKNHQVYQTAKASYFKEVEAKRIHLQAALHYYLNFFVSPAVFKKILAHWVTRDTTMGNGFFEIPGLTSNSEGISWKDTCSTICAMLVVPDHRTPALTTAMALKRGNAVTLIDWLTEAIAAIQVFKQHVLHGGKVDNETEALGYLMDFAKVFHEQTTLEERLIIGQAPKLLKPLQAYIESQDLPPGHFKKVSISSQPQIQQAQEKKSKKIKAQLVAHNLDVTKGDKNGSKPTGKPQPAKGTVTCSNYGHQGMLHATKDCNGVTDKQLLRTKEAEKSKGETNAAERNQNKAATNPPAKSQKPVYPTFECYNCGKVGDHWRHDCKEPKKQRGEKASTMATEVVPPIEGVPMMGTPRETPYVQEEARTSYAERSARAWTDRGTSFENGDSHQVKHIVKLGQRDSEAETHMAVVTSVNKATHNGPDNHDVTGLTSVTNRGHNPTGAATHAVKGSRPTSPHYTILQSFDDAGVQFNEFDCRDAYHTVPLLKDSGVCMVPPDNIVSENEGDDDICSTSSAPAPVKYGRTNGFIKLLPSFWTCIFLLLALLTKTVLGTPQVDSKIIAESYPISSVQNTTQTQNLYFAPPKKVLKALMTVERDDGTWEEIHVALDTCSTESYAGPHLTHDLRSSNLEIKTFGTDVKTVTERGDLHFLYVEVRYDIPCYKVEQNWLPSGCSALLGRPDLFELKVDLNSHCLSEEILQIKCNPPASQDNYTLDFHDGDYNHGGESAEVYMSERKVRELYTAREDQPKKVQDRRFESITVNPDLPPPTIAKIRAVLERYRPVFLEREGSPPLMKCEPVKLRLREDVEPFRCPKPTFTTYEAKFLTENYEPKLLDGSFEKAAPDCAWASRVHIATKGDDWMRACGDYVGVNSRMIQTPHNVHNKTSSVEKLGEGVYFNEFDCPDAYHMVPMHKDSREFAAIWTPMGLIQPTVATWGLSNSGDALQNCLDDIMSLQSQSLRDCTVNYADDFRQGVKTEDDIVPALEGFLQMCEDNKISLAPHKTKVGFRKTEFLGYDCQNGGTTVAEKNLAPIATMTLPKDKAALRRCLGLMVGCASGIPHYSNMTKPLTRLLGDFREILPDSEEEKAFYLARDACLKNTPSHAPNYDYPFNLDVDASDVGVGGRLYQIIDEKERNIRFVSHAYDTKKMRDRPIYYREAHAICWCLKKCRLYLRASPFPTKVYSDHAPLRWIKSAPKGTVAAWLIEDMEETPFEVTYLPGPENIIADALSRTPLVGPNTLSVRGMKQAWTDILATLSSEFPQFKDCEQPWVWAGTETLEASRTVQAWRTKANPTIKQHPNESLEKLDFDLAIMAPAAETSPAVCEALFRSNRPFAALVASDLVEYIPRGVGKTDDLDILKKVNASGKITYLSANMTWILGNMPGSGKVAEIYSAIRLPRKAKQNHQFGLGGVDKTWGDIPVVPATPSAVKEIKPIVKTPTTAKKKVAADEYIEHDPTAISVPGLTNNIWWSEHNTREVWVEAQKAEKTVFEDAYGDKIVTHSDGLMCWSETAPGTGRVIVPTDFREGLVKATHEMTCHMGAKKIDRLMEESFIWPGMSRDIKRIIKTCAACPHMNSKVQRSLGLYRTIEYSGPHEAYGIDIYSVMASVTTPIMVCILTVVDLFSKRVSFIPLPNHQAMTVLKAFLRFIVWQRGVPSVIVHDGASELVGSLASGLMEVLNIKQLVTRYWPQSNSVCERQHIFLGKAFQMLTEEEQDVWPDHCPRWEFAVNTTFNANSTVTPNQVEFGKTGRNAIESIFVRPEGSPDQSDRKTDGIFGSITESVAIYRDLASKMSTHNHEKANAKLNENGRVVEFEVGEPCLIYLPPKSKGAEGWKPKHIFSWRGPCEVISRNSTTNYTVREIASGKKFERHVGLMAPYFGHLEKDAVWGMPEKQSPLQGVLSPDANLSVGEIIVIRDNNAALFCVVTVLVEDGCEAHILTTTSKDTKSARFIKTYIEKPSGKMIRAKPTKGEVAEPWIAYVNADEVLLRGVQMSKNCMTAETLKKFKELKIPHQYIS